MGVCTLSTVVVDGRMGVGAPATVGWVCKDGGQYPGTEGCCWETWGLGICGTCCCCGRGPGGRL